MPTLPPTRSWQVAERNEALGRTNLRSSGACAVAAALPVGLLAAIDPAVPWSSVGLRAAAAFALGGATGLTLSAASHWLRVVRGRSATRESAHSTLGDAAEHEA